MNQLIFYQTLSQNLVTHSGVHSSLDKNRHHQMTFVNLIYTLNTHHPTGVYSMEL